MAEATSTLLRSPLAYQLASATGVQMVPGSSSATVAKVGKKRLAFEAWPAYLFSVCAVGPARVERYAQERCIQAQARDDEGERLW